MAAARDTLSRPCSQATPPTLEQPHFCLVYILDLLINFNFRRKDIMTMKVRKPLILDGM